MAMLKNRGLVIMLALTALFSVGAMYMAGLISFGGSGKNGGTDVASLHLGEGFDPNASFVRMPPFNLAIVQNNKMQGTLYVALDLKTGERSLNAEVIRTAPNCRMPILRLWVDTPPTKSIRINRST